MKQQTSVMMYCPAYGKKFPFPSDADQWRKYHGAMAWIFNPWTGKKRHPSDIGDDPGGLLILPPREDIVYQAGEDTQKDASAILG